MSPEGKGLFVVQPPQWQWQNLAAAMDRCMVLADHPNGVIFMGWYGHSKTVLQRPRAPDTRDGPRQCKVGKGSQVGDERTSASAGAQSSE